MENKNNPHTQQPLSRAGGLSVNCALLACGQVSLQDDGSDFGALMLTNLLILHGNHSCFFRGKII